MNPSCSFLKVISVLLIKELRSKGDKDVLIGSTLVKVDSLLFFKDQETEESGCSLQASAPLTDCLQAECGVTLALALTHTHTEENLIFHHPLSCPDLLIFKSLFPVAIDFVLFSIKWSKDTA